MVDLAAMTTTCIAVVGVLGLALILGLVLVRSITRRARMAPDLLGQAMGLDRANQGTRREPTWYRGVRDGRPFALTFVNLRYAYLKMPHEFQLSLRVVVPVRVPEALDVIAYRRHDRKKMTADASFESGFQLRHPELLAPATREALVDFARDLGGVRLRPRAGVTDALIRPGLLDEFPMILVHDRIGAKPAPEQVLQIVDRLDGIARTLEAGIDPTHT